MKVLVIHTKYVHHGGEDTVVQSEIELLKSKYTVEELIFQNKSGIKGGVQFLMSIWNIRKSNIVKNKIKAFQPDVVHLHNWHFATGPLIIRSIKHMKIPIICTLHNYRLLCPSGVLLHNNKLFNSSLQENFPWNAVIKKVYRNSFFQTFWLAFIIWFHKKTKTWLMVDKYIVLAPFAIDLFSKSKLKIPQKIFIEKPNFTSKKENCSVSKKEAHFLFVGRLSVEKGIHDLIIAFKTLPYTIKIAGDGPLRSFVEQNQLEHSNIKYLGALLPNEVYREMQSANALIFSSIWMEPFGLTIVEAFSNYCTVITSDIGAPPTIVTDGLDGFHYAFGDINSLQAVINKWATLSPTEKQLKRDNAYRTYQTKFSSQRQFLYFDAIYNSI